MPASVRTQIRRSWRRSRKNAVRIEAEPGETYTAFDENGRLLRVAAPVLTRLAAEVSNVKMAVILTDHRGLVLDRRSQNSLVRALDRVHLAPGYLYSEQSVGTNGIGTAAADHGSAWVVGNEHYVDYLRGLSCAGAVIRHPMTGRVEGVLDLTCAVDDTTPLMVPFVNQAAHEIERLLFDDAWQADRELFHTFMGCGPALRASDSDILPRQVAAAIRAAETKAVGEERRRMARELHDSVCQILCGIKLGADRASGLLARAPDEIAEPLDYIRVLAATGLADLRAVVGDLRSESIEKEGLVVTLSKEMAAVQAHHGLTVQAVLPEREPEASVETKEALFRICQEALHNVARHASAKTVRVSLKTEDEDLVLEISDDGVGFDTRQEFPGHFGLRSMRERALKSGGDFELTAAPGKGARIVVRLPAQLWEK